MLGYLETGFPTIQVGESIFKAMVPVKLADNFFGVRVLALAMPEPNLKLALDSLRCFPFLEKLHIEFSNGHRNWEDAGLYDPLTPIECLNRSLKTIELRPYEGLNSHIESAKFFIKRAKILELMKFGRCIWCATKWIEDQHRKLDIENKASKCAQFSFEHEGDFFSTFCWMGLYLKKSASKVGDFSWASFGVLSWKWLSEHACSIDVLFSELLACADLLHPTNAAQLSKKAHERVAQERGRMDVRC